MKAKDAPMTRNLCRLIGQAVAAAEEEVIGEIEIAVEETPEVVESQKTRKGKAAISEEAPAEEALAEETPAEEAPAEEAPARPVRTAIDLKCMESLKEAQRWCEETEIFGT